MGYLEDTFKEDKALLLLGYTGTSRGSLSLSSLSYSQIQTGGRGDASVGTKVLPLSKLKPLITNWENREKREAGGRWIGGRKGEREMLERKRDFGRVI